MKIKSLESFGTQNAGFDRATTEIGAAGQGIHIDHKWLEKAKYLNRNSSSNCPFRHPLPSAPGSDT